MNGQTHTNLLLMVKFPSSKANLATVGFALKNSDGSEYIPRSTEGIVNQENGVFTTTINISEVWSGLVVWDTGEETPVFAVEELNITSNATVGSGLVSVVITVEVGGIAKDGVSVYITTDEEGSNIVAGTLFTNDFGQVNFYLNEGVYYVWKQLSGYNFNNPESITVAL